MDNENNKIVIKDDDGIEYLLNVLFRYHNDERDEDYFFIYDESDPDSTYVVKYGENGEVIFVDEGEEFEEAQEVFEAFNEDPQIQELKK